MEALRGLASTGDCNCTLYRVMENGAKGGVRRGRRGREEGMGGMEVAGVVGAGQIKAYDYGTTVGTRVHDKHCTVRCVTYGRLLVRLSLYYYFWCYCTIRYRLPIPWSRCAAPLISLCVCARESAQYFT
jgi:hypothetical protein